MSIEVPDLAKHCICLDLMVEILKRLPVKYILRMRCVCKSWHSLTQENHFISQHIESCRNPSTLSIITLSWAPRKDDFSLHYLSSEGWQRFDMAGLDRSKYFCISNSYNGLVCLYSPGYVYVVNPCIREVFILPKAEGSALSVALGFDETTNEYKVVRLFKREKESERTECQIFTLSSPLFWRSIVDAPLDILYFSSPVIANEAIHWGIRYGTENGIALSFDIKNDSFKVIMPPDSLSEFQHTKITELGGKLCLSVVDKQDWHHQPFRRDIWILSDYEKCIWTRESFCLDRMERPSPNEVFNTIPIAIHKEKIVWSTSTGRLDFYDRKTRKFEKPMYINGKSVVPFVESLVSPIGIREKGAGRRLPEWSALRWTSRGEWGRGLPYSEWVWDGEKWFKRECKADS